MLYEFRQAFLEEWISKEDLLDAFQRKVISYREYLWIIGAEEVYRLEGFCKITIE